MLTRRSVVSHGIQTAGALAISRALGQAAGTAATVGSMDAMRAAAAKAVITPQALRGGASFLRGPFGNILVLVQPDGVVVVDSGLREARPQIQAAIATLSPQVPGSLINTHWHIDHTDGNEWMQARGAVITAQRNTARRLSTPQETAAMHQVAPAAPVSARPTDVFDTEAHKHMGSVNLALTYYGPAHTDGDISIHLLEPDVMHVGDIWYNGFYPLIDYSSGGNIDGMIKAAETTLKRVTASTMIVPGHGPLGTREQLEGWLEMMTGVRETVAALKRQGKTLEEVVQSRPTAKYDGKFIARAIPTDVFVACVYQTV